ncbi:MAG: UMP kinase [Candidatus Pacearchaeota archaeon]
MKKRIIVISLGGSLIVPEEINIDFLRNFKEVINKNLDKFKFVIVCGGGSVARKYIQALKEEKRDEYLQSLIGISITRLNARFLSYFFGFDSPYGIPHSIKEVDNLLKRRDIVFCGALKYAPKQTSDSAAAKLAKFFKTTFINLTNVDGIFDKDPKKYPNAKFIPKISFSSLYKILKKIEYSPGVHTPLDLSAFKLIKKYKIKTFILGKNLSNLDNLLNDREFRGTRIE